MHADQELCELAMAHVARAVGEVHFDRCLNGEPQTQ